MDACRGAAALAIVVCHSYPRPQGPLADWANEMRIGVQVFFALSGFLLFRPYLVALADGSETPRLRDYLKRRVLRIVPAYWVALTILGLTLGPPYIRDLFSGGWWLLYGFGQTYSEHYRFSGISVAWTLSVEASFYLFLPLFAEFTRRMTRRAGWRASAMWGLLVLSVFGIGLRALEVYPNRFSATAVHFTFGLPGEIEYFAIGMALAVVSVDRERRGPSTAPIEWLIRHPSVAWLIAGACFAFGSTFGGYISPVAVPAAGQLSFPARFVADSVLEGVFAGLILMPAAFESARPRLPQRILGLRVLGFLGVVSYGMYLWHGPVGGWLVHEWVGQHAKQAWPLGVVWTGCALIVGAVGVLAGTLSYYLIELPFLRRKPGWRPAGRRATPISVQ